ncbi:MAG: GTP-binding protein [Clostridia bacterium]|nr:GTP-binding protein [Clostridia bacterium]
MTKIDIFSGFLGAGKTTLIKKLIKEAYSGEKLVLIENEFGDIGIDGGFLAEAGIKINELNSGCICCSLVGDFAKALNKVYEEYHPDRILIEPSGVGKLSDVIKAVYSAELPDSEINTYTAVVDAAKCKMYMKNFGEFFNDQIETANCIVFSHADVAGEEKLAKAAALVREHNAKATLVTTPWQELDGKDILAAMEHSDTLTDMLAELKEHCHEHHHHDDEDEEHEHCCHDHDEEHEHDHDHEHHHHHHADEVFESWGVETAKSFTKEELTAALSELTNSVQYGTILRAKGIVKGKNGGWLHFDYVPGEPEVRDGCAAYTGRLCVIGSKIDKEELFELFGV